MFRFDALQDRLWVLGQMGAARLTFARMPEARFWKLCGSGTGEGFTPVPNTAVWAILAVWDDEATARDQAENAPVFKRWRSKANECWTVFLSAYSSRGQWSGSAPFDIGAPAEHGPIAILTRATVKPSAMMRFWQRTPDISQVIGNDPNVLFKIGIGEVPWLQQVTFSIWPDTETMVQFARKDGPHARAIRAVREGNWFREELYARFNVLGSAGHWNGVCPLNKFERSAA